MNQASRDASLAHKKSHTLILFLSLQFLPAEHERQPGRCGVHWAMPESGAMSGPRPRAPMTERIPVVSSQRLSAWIAAEALSQAARLPFPAEAPDPSGMRTYEVGAWA